MRDSKNNPRAIDTAVSSSSKRWLAHLEENLDVKGQLFLIRLGHYEGEFAVGLVWVGELLVSLQSKQQQRCLRLNGLSGRGRNAHSGASNLPSGLQLHPTTKDASPYL